MDYNLKIIDHLKSHSNFQQILQVALEVLLQEKNYASQLIQYRDGLSRNDKVLVTKCTKVLKEMAMKNHQEQQKTFDRISKIDKPISDFINQHILPIIQFERRLNNYSFIKYYSDPEGSRPPIQTIVEAQQQQHDNLTSFESDFAKVEWKVEITLFSIQMKKIIRPLILLIFHTNSGTKKTMYLDIGQFQELRKNVALVLRQVHLMESIQINI